MCIRDRDYRNEQVLMLAYMNEEAFNVTINSGRMTYWSRSRNELWTKGLTSGHLQYVKSLTADCDYDTIPVSYTHLIWHLLFIITRQLRCCESRKLIPHCAAYSSILA